MADGDATEIPNAIHTVACAGGMASVAKVAKIIREGRYRAVGENGDPKLAMVLKDLGAFGLRLHVQPIASAKRVSVIWKKAYAV